MTRPDSLIALPSSSPVGSRMAIMLGGAAFRAASKLKDKLIAIGAHELDIPRERAVYAQGAVYDRNAPDKRVGWDELMMIAHRNYHRMPPGMEPGLPLSTSSRCRPAARCRRRTAACRCIRAVRSNSI